MAVAAGHVVSVAVFKPSGTRSKVNIVRQLNLWPNNMVIIISKAFILSLAFP